MPIHALRISKYYEDFYAGRVLVYERIYQHHVAGSSCRGSSVGGRTTPGKTFSAVLPGGSKLFILVSECLPGIISVPLPGHFGAQGPNMNNDH